MKITHVHTQIVRLPARRDEALWRRPVMTV